MNYRIARNGQIFGPYTTAHVLRYIASGNILPTDLAQAEGTDEWLPVEQVFPATPQAVPVAPYPGGLPRLFPDPPDFPWWAALLLGIFTGGIFFVVWDVYEAAWLHRLERASNALWLYIACVVLYLFRFPTTYHQVTHNIFGDEIYVTHHSGSLGLLALVLAIVARFVFRAELLRHFNAVEPIGLRLNGFLTLLFGGLYFQYHFNRINDVKRALRVSVPG